MVSHMLSPLHAAMPRPAVGSAGSRLRYATRSSLRAPGGRGRAALPLKSSLTRFGVGPIRWLPWMLVAYCLRAYATRTALSRACLALLVLAARARFLPVMGEWEGSLLPPAFLILGRGSRKSSDFGLARLGVCAGGGDCESCSVDDGDGLSSLKRLGDGGEGAS